jgi:hypothetical protein
MNKVGEELKQDVLEQQKKPIENKVPELLEKA